MHATYALTLLLWRGFDAERLGLVHGNGHRRWLVEENTGLVIQS